MTNESQPIDQRTQTIADLRELLDYLAARPDVPLDRYGDPLHYSVQLDDDERGLAAVERIAAALGVPVTDSHGKPPKADTSQFAAQYSVGRATYSAVYILRADVEEYAENQRWIADRRKALES